MKNMLARRVRTMELVDMQSGGDVGRVVVSGIGGVPGRTPLEKMRYLQDYGDGLRRLLLSEPYGDPAMSVDLIVEPSHPEAQIGYITMAAVGYPLYSSSNTICTATAVLETGLVPMLEGEQTIVLESPAGLERVKASNANGRVESLTTRGEPAYVAAQNLSIEVPHYGRVTYDLVWSGAFFALVDASSAGFRLVRDELIALTTFGDAFVRAVGPEIPQEHPDFGDLGPFAFVLFCGPVERLEEQGYCARSATYMHPGIVCRSPTGTGTSARLALLHHRGEIHQGEWLETMSPRESRLVGTVLGEAKVGNKRALHSHITGRAWTLAHSTISVNLDDPLVDISDLEHLLRGGQTYQPKRRTDLS